MGGSRLFCRVLFESIAIPFDSGGGGFEYSPLIDDDACFTYDKSSSQTLTEL